ncbi:hypothetical protein FACS189452_00800 [Bacteroidia bacterium]|nr:hypothetical protein FACS189452_00800 [Bacteroidia bacterium]
MLTACSEKRPAVVENPVFDVWNSATLEVHKIEMSDTATVLHIGAYFTPNMWIRVVSQTYIRESGDTQKLIVTRAEGIGLDEEFFMPESGEHSFALYFPPLPPNVTKIDFIESDCGECFKTWGIYLLPSAKLQTVPPLKSVNQISTKPLPEPFIAAQKTTLRGQLLGYHKDMGLSVEVYANELFASDDNPITLKVADDGSFEGELPINRPQITSISAAGLELYTFLVPGEEQEIYIDLRKKSRREARHRPDKDPSDSAYIYTSGIFSPTEMDEILAPMNSIRKWDSYEAFVNTISNMPPQEYRQYLMDGWLQQNLAKTPANLSPNAKHLSELSARLDALIRLLQYEDMQKIAYQMAHEHEKPAKAGYKPTQPPLEYYSFLKDLVTDDMVFTEYYKYFVKYLINADLFLPQGNPSVGERFAYFKEKVTPLLSNGHTMLMDIAYATMYTERFEKTAKLLTDAEKQEITAAVTHKAVAQLLISANDQLQQILAQTATSSIMHETPQASNEKLLGAILANYKGKVAVVDFWATWCGPCLKANKEMKPLKEELSGKDVVYIYLTGETSPLATWRKMIPDIAGNHYRVSEAQWRYWSDIIPVPGVPTYLIFDKNGKQTYKQTGYPGAAKIKEEIMKNL